MTASTSQTLARALETRTPVRVYTADGEVLVAQVLSWDGADLVYAPLRSSRPERYAVCDATGFSLPVASICRVQLLDGRPGSRPRPSS
jgi:hypothetical protein